MNDGPDETGVTLQPDAICPNCQKPIPNSSLFCPGCGYGKKQIHFSSDPITFDGFVRKPSFINWWLIIILLFIVPCAAFGSCLLSNPSIDHPDWRIDAAGYVELASIALGIIFLFVNLVISLFRAK